MPLPVMPLKRSILIVSVSLALSCHKAPKPEIMTIYYYHFDILHGRVKQLSETYKTESYSQPDTTTTDFDVHGNSLQTKTKGDCMCAVKYVYRYGKNGERIELIAKSDVRLFPNKYKYNANGRVVELKVDTKMLKENSNKQMQDKFFYKYDVAGNRIQEDRYLEQELQGRKKYKYDNHHNLVEEEVYSYFGAAKSDTLDTKRLPHVKIIYHYTSFDSKGNWLKRIADEASYVFNTVKKDTATGKTTYYELGLKPAMKKDTVTRKITYY